MGYPGDPVLDDPRVKVKRPSWTKDGTILVFRKLEQSVIPFEDYLATNGRRWREFIPGGEASVSPPLSDQEGADLFGARLLGRWKSVSFTEPRISFDDKIVERIVVTGRTSCSLSLPRRPGHGGRPEQKQ